MPLLPLHAIIINLSSVWSISYNLRANCCGTPRFPVRGYNVVTVAAHGVVVAVDGDDTTVLVVVAAVVAATDPTRLMVEKLSLCGRYVGFVWMEDECSMLAVLCFFLLLLV